MTINLKIPKHLADKLLELLYEVSGNTWSDSPAGKEIDNTIKIFEKALGKDE